MYKSDIFDEYAKQMIKDGFVKEAEEKPKKSLDDLKNLYNIKPNGKDDEESIIEKAHPETAVIGRAYDAMNAIVENEHQRQDVIAWIALKFPDGHLTHQRYVKAKSDLMNSIVQVAFKADSDNNEDLMKLADSCSEQLNKKAIALPALLGYSGLAAGLGYLSWAMYGGVSVQNVYANSKLLLDQLSDVSEKPYAQHLTNTVNKLMSDAIDFNEIRMRAISQSLTSVDELVDKTVASQADLQRLSQIETIWDAFLKLHPRYVEAIEMSMDQGGSESPDWWEKIKQVSQTFIPSLNEEKQVLDYLNGLKDAVLKAKKDAQQIKTFGQQKAQELKPQLEESLNKQKDNLNIPNLEDLAKELEGHVPQ